MTAVAAKVMKASLKEKARAMIEVPHTLYEQLLWHKKIASGPPYTELGGLYS